MQRIFFLEQRMQDTYSFKTPMDGVSTRT